MFKKQLKKTYWKIKAEPLYFVISMFFDFCYLFFQGFVLGYLANQILYNFNELSKRIVPETPKLVEFSQTISEILKGAPQTDALLYNIAGLALANMIFFYVIYNFFQGFSWSYCHKLWGHKTRGYVKHFFYINIFWIALWILYQPLDFLNIASVEFGIKNIYYITLGLMGVFWAVWIYFAFTSYSKRKNAFKLGKAIQKKNFSKLIMAVPLFVAVSILLTFLAYLSTEIYYVLGTILALAFVSFIKVYFIGVIND